MKQLQVMLKLMKEVVEGQEKKLKLIGQIAAEIRVSWKHPEYGTYLNRTDQGREIVDVVKRGNSWMWIVKS
jgi:hypothetical protein